MSETCRVLHAVWKGDSIDHVGQHHYGDHLKIRLLHRHVTYSVEDVKSFGGQVVESAGTARERVAYQPRSDQVGTHEDGL